MLEEYPQKNKEILFTFKHDYRQKQKKKIIVKL
jgi:hypothetical protein